MTFTARTKAVFAFLIFALIGLSGFLVFRDTLSIYGSFVLCGLIGMLVSNRVFQHYSSTEEKREDLEERVRNPD